MLHNHLVDMRNTVNIADNGNKGEIQKLIYKANKTNDTKNYLKKSKNLKGSRSKRLNCSREVVCRKIDSYFIKIERRSDGIAETANKSSENYTDKILESTEIDLIDEKPSLSSLRGNHEFQDLLQLDKSCCKNTASIKNDLKLKRMIRIILNRVDDPGSSTMI